MNVQFVFKEFILKFLKDKLLEYHLFHLYLVIKWIIT